VCGWLVDVVVVVVAVVVVVVVVLVLLCLSVLVHCAEVPWLFGGERLFTAVVACCLKAL